MFLQLLLHHLFLSRAGPHRQWSTSAVFFLIFFFLTKLFCVVITSRYWGFQWQPGGSTQVHFPSARSHWCLSIGFWWTRSSSFWNPLSLLHASPDWTQSFLTDPAEAAGSSPWSKQQISKIHKWWCLFFVCSTLQTTEVDQSAISNNSVTYKLKTMKINQI